jgi:2-polyprenyl-6-methoxyphenol hydroxylase-like FAD-dependent oxidoreductase
MVFGPPQRIVDSLRPEETTMTVARLRCSTRSVFDAELVTIAHEQEVAVGKIGERAVVLGASMGGLLAARVLADFYRTVAVIERDVLPDDPAQRRGVPQGQHVHALLSSGSQILGRLFPGLLDELVADGAKLLDEGDLSSVSLRFGGHELDRTGKFADPARLMCYLASRPFLESHVRRRVSAIGNLAILDGHDVVELVAAEPDRVTGARVANRDTGEEKVLDAELVIDAMGRGARTPAFLDTLGYGRPVQDRMGAQVAYVSQLLRIPPGTLSEKVISVGPVPERPTAGALFSYEDDTWMMTLAGLTGRQPPADRAGMIAFAAEFAPPAMLAALHAAEPLGEVYRYRYPASQWRRYDKMRRFPAGLLVFGDAICSFNPIYGQGMSVAALEAVALRDCLLRGDADLSRRFFRAAAKPVRTAWRMAVAADLALPQVLGRRSIPMRLSNWYTDRVLAAAESDTVVTEGFFRVMNLVDPPARLLHPFFLMRVAATNRRCRDDKPTNPLPLKSSRQRDHEIAIGGGKLARRLTAEPHLSGSSDAARPSRDSFGHEMADALWPQHQTSVISPAERGRRR